MTGSDPTPEELAALHAAEIAYIGQARGFIVEARRRPKQAVAVAEAIVALEAAMGQQGIKAAALRQNYSMALRACDKNDLADKWQIAALEEFSRYPALKFRASMLAHSVADSCFQTERYTEAESWASRSITEAIMANHGCGWLADTWRIYGQALQMYNEGPEVEERLREAVRLWKTMKEPDPRRSMYAFAGLAMFLRGAKKYAESEAAFEDAIEFSRSFPAHAKAYHDIAVAQLNRYRSRN